MKRIETEEDLQEAFYKDLFNDKWFKPYITEAIEKDGNLLTSFAHLTPHIQSYVDQRRMEWEFENSELIEKVKKKTEEEENLRLEKREKEKKKKELQISKKVKNYIKELNDKISKIKWDGWKIDETLDYDIGEFDAAISSINFFLSFGKQKITQYCSYENEEIKIDSNSLARNILFTIEHTKKYKTFRNLRVGNEDASSTVFNVINPIIIKKAEQLVQEALEIILNEKEILDVIKDAQKRELKRKLQIEWCTITKSEWESIFDEAATEHVIDS
jgi:hypothetical protein